MEEIELTVELRKNTGGKGNLSSARKQKKIPGVVYGGKKPPVSVSMQEKDLLIALKGGANTVIRMQYPGGADTVIVKARQRHVVTDALTHVDFYRISLTEKIEVRIPLKLVGTSPGVEAHGGLMEHSLREFRVRCLPTKIPKELSADISNLEIGSTLLVKDVKVSEDVEVLDDAQHIIVTVVTPKEEEIPEVAPAEAEAEPEVIAKGKKEEEAEAGEGESKEKSQAKPVGKEASKPEAEKK